MLVLSVLDRINVPADLRSLTIDELKTLADELREFVQHVTKTKAGHIKSSLGVTELSIALHYVFNTPEDILIWDVGHQAYIHKILTGRKDLFHTNRQLGGISGFTKRDESEYDPFGAGHSSTSISATVGFATAAKLSGIKRQHIAVIGDGSLTGGESFEALNYLGDKQLDVIVVLNDNESSIDANVGGLAKYSTYRQYCQSLGVEYHGDVDGHDLQDLVKKLSELKSYSGPHFIRIKTRKALGWKEPVEEKQKQESLSFQDIFADTLTRLAEQNSKIVALSPAMLSGSSLNKFQEKFPGRTFDVGIAEQHVVTMAAAMAAEGYIPFCHLYSTFSQRAFDQIVHDVALQNLPVVFCLDRAGLVGEDGPTHHGSFDVGFLHTVPNMKLAAPMDGSSLVAIVEQAIETKGPMAIRYPKGGKFKNVLPAPDISFGKLRELKPGVGRAYISYGAIGETVAEVVKDTDAAHFDLVYLSPLDRKALSDILLKYEELIVVEENSLPGGVGEAILSLKEEVNSSAKIIKIGLPHRFIGHGKKEELLKGIGMDRDSLSRI